MPNGISSTPRLKSNAIQFLQGIFLFYLNARRQIDVNTASTYIALVSTVKLGNKELFGCRTIVH